MNLKIGQSEFYGDTKGLLRLEVNYDHKEAWRKVKKEFIEKF